MWIGGSSPLRPVMADVMQRRVVGPSVDGCHWVILDGDPFGLSGAAGGHACHCGYRRDPCPARAVSVFTGDIRPLSPVEVSRALPLTAADARDLSRGCYDAP